MTQTKQHELRIAISKYHEGQAVSPLVAATASHPMHKTCRVELRWFDASDRTTTQAVRFEGSRAEAEAWLRRQGVHLDAQGIH